MSRAAVEADLPTSCHGVSDWGGVTVAGREVLVEAAFDRMVGVACLQVITTVSHVYELGRLAPGCYRLVFRAWGMVVKTHRFTVPQERCSQTRLYQITSGSYIQIGGIWGVMASSLPNQTESLIELTADQACGTAQLRFLSPELVPQFPILTNGRVEGGAVTFFYQTQRPPPLTWDTALVDYRVVLEGDSLTLNGSVTAPPRCCDIPYKFIHTNVQAVAVTPQRPTLSIARSGTNLVVTWCPKSPGFRLEMAGVGASGDPARWQWVSAGSANPALVPVSSRARFFRLCCP